MVVETTPVTNRDKLMSNLAAYEGWKAFWHSCMRQTGGQSLLPVNITLVSEALATPAPPPQPKSELAQLLEGDERISDITLSDVLCGLENYFALFREVKKVNPYAYEYFSRVGVPLCMNSTAVYKGHIDDYNTPITNPTSLPAYLGVFFARSDEDARKDWIEDRPTFLDFHLYEKRRRNLAIPPGWKFTIYDHAEFHLHRDIMSKAEQRKHHYWDSWGFHYFIGIDDAGIVHALPMHRNYLQPLPKGGHVPHREFAIPRGLRGHGRERKLTPHEYVALHFSVIRAFAASALMGVQLSIRKGRQVARFGVPLSHVRSFFRDRDPTGNRRNPILHFVGNYSYTRANGKLVTVGEHLRGARHFTWRDYSIVVSAPGIHHPSPEGLHVEVMSDDDLMPIPEKGVTDMYNVAGQMQSVIESRKKTRFHHGKPTTRYNTHALDRPTPPSSMGIKA